MISATAIIDCRAPRIAIEHLQNFANVFLFYSEDLSYDAIACHPDIFLFKGTDSLFVAPNAPKTVISLLIEQNVRFEYGVSLIGKELENSCYYNCVETKTHFFHKHSFTDTKLLHSLTKPFIHLPQAYTRCSLFALSENSFITSDKGIEKILLNEGFNCFYSNPSSILLPPYKNGFIGGCMGILDNRLFIIGSLDTLEKGADLRCIIENEGIEIVELYDGRLYDGGGIFFV
jgi:hypothetical protein